MMMPEEKQRFDRGLPVQPRNASENETYSSTEPLQSPARGHGLRAAIAVILGFGLIFVLSVLSRGAVCQWIALVLPLIAIYVAFELTSVKHVAEQTRLPALLWFGVCPECSYSLPRSGAALAKVVPDPAARAALPQHERTTRCSECGGSWDLSRAQPETFKPD